MDALTIIALVLIVVLVVLWIFYNRYTNRIIEDLLAENVSLTRDLDKLQKELSKEREIKGEAFKPMTFTASIRPVNFPNSEVNHNED